MFASLNWAHEPNLHWDNLSPEQKTILEPAKPDWEKLTQMQRTHLINAARHYPSLTPEEQARFRARIPEWTRLPKEQREEARKNYKTYRALPPEKKEAVKSHWQAVQPPPAPAQ